MQSKVYILLYSNLKYPAKSVNLEGGNKDKRAKDKGTRTKGQSLRVLVEGQRGEKK